MAEKRSTTKELRAQPEGDLRAQLDKLQRELWEHRVKVKDGSLQQTHLLPDMRRQIARIHTILREQQSARQSAKANR